MNTINRFPIPKLDPLSEDIRARIVAVHQKAGFIPNVFLAWAHRPEDSVRSLCTTTRCSRKRAASRKRSAR